MEMGETNIKSFSKVPKASLENLQPAKVESTDDTCRCTGFTLNGVNLSLRPIILSCPCHSGPFPRPIRSNALISFSKLMSTLTYCPRVLSVGGFHSFLGKKKIEILLAEHFRYCGEISHIYITLDSANRVVGTAFLKFSSDEGYRKALELNGTEFEDGYLEVKKSVCRCGLVRFFAGGSKSFGGWDRRRGTFEMTAGCREKLESEEMDIEEQMPKPSLKNLQPELAAKVESTDDACRCIGLTLNGVNMSGSPILLSRPCDSSAFTRISSEELKRTPTYYPRVVFVYGFDRFLGKKKIEILLAEHFRHCGEILHIHVPLHGDSTTLVCLAYLKFSSDEGYNKAIELNGTEFGDGNKLEVLKFRCMLDPRRSFCRVRSGVHFGRIDSDCDGLIGDRGLGTYKMTAVGKGKKITFED